MNPLINTPEKMYGVSFIPYRKIEGEWAFFLQKRGPTFRILANMFSTFGGRVEEAETSEEACVREVMEELQYTPKAMQYFSHYESASAVLDVFIEEVGEDFESRVTVCEGEYGTFKTVSDIRSDITVSPLTRLIALEIAKHLG